MLQDFPTLIQTLHAQIFEPERIPMAMVALVLVTLIGMVRGALGGMATPFYWHIIDILFGKFGDKMNKSGRPKGDLIFRGFILTIIALLLTSLLGAGAYYLSQTYSTWSILEILFLSLCLTSGAVFAALGQLYKALNDKKVTQGAYFTIARSTRTNLSKADDYTITRVGMGLGLKSFDKGIVAPILWYLIAGVPAALIYAALAALSWRFGREGHYNGLGQSAMALERLMGFIPNIFSGILIALAGLLTPTAGMTRAFIGLFQSKRAASYAEGGLPLSAAAFALKVSLGGPTQDLDGFAIKRGWFGPADATAQLEAKHLHRVVYICFMAHLLFLAVLSGAMVAATL